MRLVITRSDSGWAVRHEGEGASEIIDLFGTDTLPTPFTPNARADDVLAEVARLNPGAAVVLFDTHLGTA